ncbi:nucleoporin SEH1-like [Dermatophagoides pteronyssinus]|uniref:nucleoporin SEH1-like n=1 Tax=Dermatophagoides pteronyssinus TaxID=6956 RepID=UPI003F6694AF
MVSRSIQADHKDLIHDIAYDYYGRRLATCSSDQSVKVWDIGDEGQWTCTSSWKTHAGSVWKVTWAHPEFGQILATCSFDRTAIVWEEMVADNNTNEKNNQSVWIKRHSFVDSRTSVTDVKFAPKHFGLILSTCSLDGIIRIYEAPDVMNITQWSIQYEINCNKACSSISWNPSLFRQNFPMIAVGSDDNNVQGSKILFYEFNDQARDWQQIVDKTFKDVNELVHDIAFAPNVGRSYDLLGAATTKDVKIISIRLIENEKDSTEPFSQTSSVANSINNPPIGSKRRYNIKVVASFDDHGSQVWRVSWNITGTLMASSGDDGAVRLWKANCFEKWQNVGILKADQNTIHPNTITGLRGVNNFTEDRQQDGTSSSATKFVFSQ